MPKIQKCRNGCNQLIAVQQDPTDGKWKPYTVYEDGRIGDKHNCPKSPYYNTSSSQQQQQENVVMTTTPQTRSTQGGFSIAVPSDAGDTLDVKRIKIMLQEYQSVVESLRSDIRALNNKIEMNTYIDTNKLVGQLQYIYDYMAKHESMPETKTADELFTETNHLNRVDEYERTKEFVKSNTEDENNE